MGAPLVLSPFEKVRCASRLLQEVHTLLLAAPPRPLDLSLSRAMAQDDLQQAREALQRFLRLPEDEVF